MNQWQQPTLDGRPANIPSMHRKNLATTVNPDFSILSTTQYMRTHENTMWLKNQKSVLSILAIKVILKITLRDLHNSNHFLTMISPSTGSY